VAKDSIAERADLVIHTPPSTSKMVKSVWLSYVKEFVFKCTECNSEELELVQGMELLVENIEVADG